MEELNSTVQDSKTLSVACKNHPKTETEKGIDPADTQQLDDDIRDAEDKGTEQMKSVEAVGTATDLQNKSVAKAKQLINKTRNAGRGGFGEDNKAKMKELHVGVDLTNSVKKVQSELKYTKSVALDNKAVLLKNGMDESDFALFDTIYAELDGNDTVQENLKKVQKGTTANRDDSMKKLQKTARRIRNIAKNIFADRPDILVEFERIPPGRGGKTPPPQPPAK